MVWGQIRRISVNALFQLGGQLLPLFAGAASIPAIYRNLGADQFGIFTICLSALGLFSLLDLGLGRATVRFAARAIGDGRLVEAASVVMHSAALLGGASLALCVLVLMSVPLIEVHWVHAAAGQVTQVRWCLYVLALALPFCGLTSVFRAALEAHEEFRFISVSQVALGTGTYVLPLGLSYLTHDVRWLVGGAVICRMIVTLTFLVGGLRKWPGKFSWRAKKIHRPTGFHQFSFWTVISNVVGSAIVYVDRALLVRVVGFSEVSFYNVPLEMLGRLMIIVNSVVTVIFPALSKASDKAASYEDLYISAVLALSVVTGTGLLLLSVFTPELLKVWLGIEFQQKSSEIVRILLMGLAFQVVNVVALASLNAKGFARPISLMHISEVPLYLAALYIVGVHFGLVGVAIVWSARLFVEYMCFRGFEFYVVASDIRPKHMVASVLVLSNLVPLCVMCWRSEVDLRVLALILWLTFVVLSLVWVLRSLRSAFGRSAAC